MSATINRRPQKPRPHYAEVRAGFHPSMLAGLGVEGDAHLGETVKHRSRVAKDPIQPNLRQVHLMHSELHTALRDKGTRLLIGEAIIEITGLRNPCLQLEGIQKGLMKTALDRDEDGNLIRKAGIMGIVRLIQCCVMSSEAETSA